MASIVSRYSDAVSANVPSDALAPKPPVLTTVTAIQDTSAGAIPKGRSTLTPNWTLPTENEAITGESLGVSTGGADVFEADYDPIVAGSYIVYADGSPLTETTDYSIVLSTGVVTLVSGQTLAGDVITIDYTVTLQDLDHLEAYAIPGNLPIPDGGSYAAVTGHGSVVTVDNNISSAATSLQDVLTDTENGSDRTYYVFAVDDESSPNISIAAAVFTEILPSIPQNLQKTVGDAKIVVSWDALSDTNINGVNVYRSDGLTFDPATAVKANSSLVTTLSFEDSAANTTNRVSEAVLPFAANGSPYSLKTESEDAISDWDTGTVNQSQGVAEVTTASKTV